MSAKKRMRARVMAGDLRSYYAELYRLSDIEAENLVGYKEAWVIERTQQNYEMMVEQMATVQSGCSEVYWRVLHVETREAYRRSTRGMLASVGILQPSPQPMSSSNKPLRSARKTQANG